MLCMTAPEGVPDDMRLVPIQPVFEQGPVNLVEVRGPDFAVEAARDDGSSIGGEAHAAGPRVVGDPTQPTPPLRQVPKSDAAVAMTSCTLDHMTRKWRVHMEPPLEMVRTGERAEDIRLNMRRVLDALEAIIRRWPEQWQMFVPVWPALPEG